MITVAEHLRWGSYCCLRGGSGRFRRRWHRRGWSLSALLVVDTMLSTVELRIDPVAFRLVYQARELIESGLNGGNHSYVLAARDDLRRAIGVLEGDYERSETRDQG